MARKNEEILVPEVSQVPWAAAAKNSSTGNLLPKELELSGSPVVVGKGENVSGKSQKFHPAAPPCLALPQENTWHLSGERISCLETPNCVSGMAKVHFLCLGEGQKRWSIRAAARAKAGEVNWENKMFITQNNLANVRQVHENLIPINFCSFKPRIFVCCQHSVSI